MIVGHESLSIKRIGCVLRNGDELVAKPIAKVMTCAEFGSGGEDSENQSKTRRGEAQLILRQPAIVITDSQKFKIPGDMILRYYPRGTQ